MAILAIYTIGDTRPLEISGGTRVPNRPQTYEELYRRRATELAGSSGSVQGFASVTALTTWCALPANYGRFDDVRFIGHGGAGVFALAVNVVNHQAQPDGMLNLITSADVIIGVFGFATS
jgi:hypothetical protein